jgi:hypothetical protein
VAVSGSAWNLLSGLSFNSVAGTITLPFVADVLGGFISQTIETGLAGGGRAVYGFTISTPGEYVISANVDAPADNANSLFVNIDAEPTDPVAIWDIAPLTTGFQDRVVSLRGTGAFDNPQFSPKVFTLAAGTHQLIIRGREANVKLGRITIAPYSGTSSNVAQTVWYVDNAVVGGGNNGSSWSNAWRSFSSVVWGPNGVKAGDTLYISGGRTSKIYTESWSVGASGTVDKPIRIALDANNSDHNGLVIFDYNFAGDQATMTGITCSQNYITFDGTVGGESKFVVSNLRNYLNRYAAVGIYGDSTAGIVVDHVTSTNCNNPIKFVRSTQTVIRNCKLMQVRGDAGISIPNSSGGWDANLVYSNVVEMLHNTSAPAGRSGYVGPDGVQCGSGVSMFGNKLLVSRTSVYTSDQHPDSVQAIGNYLKIYGNEFQDIGDSAIDYDCYANANPHDIWIYNNIFRITQNIDPYPEYFRLYTSANSVSSIVNVKILNNTFVDNTGQYQVIRFDGFNGNPSASGNEIKNNIFYNCGRSASERVISISQSSGFSASSFSFDGNIYYHPANQAYINFRGTNYAASAWVTAFEPKGTTSAPRFVSYVVNGAENDFRLSPIDTAARDKGLTESAYFSVDKNGVSRPQGVAWDIGAHELVGGATQTNLPPTLTAITQNAADVNNSTSGLQVYEGMSVQYAATASDPNNDPLTWQWFYSVNGGADVLYSSGTGSAATANFSYPAGTATRTYVWKLRVSDGRASAESQLNVGVLSPPPTTESLTFEAESGVISVPFIVSSGYIYQTSQTSVTTGGRAVFNFTINNPGDYIIQALLNAPSDGANSFFVNIDAEPQDPYMVWQIPVSSGFQTRIVNWQGAGTWDNPQFVPKVFHLATGAHQLIIRGREANTQLDRLSLVRLPDAPKNLQVVDNP